jgi:excisionase family DNA binding protein
VVCGGPRDFGVIWMARMSTMSMLTTKQAAERAGVSPALVYAWCREGRLPHMRLGRTGKRGAIRIAEADLDALLQACTKRGGGESPAPSLKHLTVS